jgi:hypothetical protein
LIGQRFDLLLLLLKQDMHLSDYLPLACATSAAAPAPAPP